MACLCGGVFALAAPPANLYAALWVGMVGLALTLYFPLDHRGHVRRRFAGARRGWAFGAGANVIALRFVPDVIQTFTPLPWAAGLLALVLLAGAQALRWLVAGVVHRQLVRAKIPGFAAFAVGVYAGTFVPAIFPWNPAGGVTPWPEMVQLADVVGERGVSALMALSAGLLADAILIWRGGPAVVGAKPARRALLMVAAAAFLPLATYAHGSWKIGQIEALRAAAPTAKIALVQPSIGATERWDRAQAEGILEKLTALTKSAERKGAELTIWPESAYPYVIGHTSRRAPIGSYAPLQPGVHGPVLTGTITSAGHDSFNSALVCATDGSLSAPYDKIHLLWFGETVPLGAELPWIRTTFARGMGLAAGEKQVLLSSGAIHAAALNCFEDTLPSAGREAMSVAPNLLVNVTNDAWFKGSSESELHLRMAVMRSVEARRDMVRAVNFGPTSWVDAAGRVRARYASDIPGTLLTEPALLDGPPTLFSRFGDAPWALLVALAIALAIWKARPLRA